ncbi:helix-turn-helix domain-containing protein [Cetobacterium sp. SF1]|uniref:helix-turn-helix domain-containing protein n=1 Tax=Cetobacterium sp. SF1 TaxID=3417654 RepID=UPI003CED72F0
MCDEKFREDLLKKYGETMSVTEIAKEFNYSLRTIRKAIRGGELEGRLDGKNPRNYVVETESLMERINI